MKLYVPEIGDHVRLTDDWTFTLYNEHRNTSLWNHFECEIAPEVIHQRAAKDALRNELKKLENKMYPGNVYWRRNSGHPVDPADEARHTELYDLLRREEHTTVLIPSGSVLSVDRIFIRKGMDDWSSLTFYLKECPGISLKKKPRFWAKLADCNNIMFDTVSNT
jgi:hypothetical protein